MPGVKKILKEATYKGLEAFIGKSGIARNINGEKINFPVRYARYFESDYEKLTFQFLRENCPTGGVFLDCGGHIGLFAVVGARLVGETGSVFSFEPTPLSRTVLKQTVQLNKCQNIVEVRPEAVSKTTGTAVFFDTGTEASNANSLVKSDRHDTAQGLEVKTVSLDDFVAEKKLPRVDCLKIDVEGSEFDALLGAGRVIARHRPAISLGLHPFAFEDTEKKLGEIWDLLESYNLRVKYENQLIDKDWFVRQTKIFDVQSFPAER